MTELKLAVMRCVIDGKDVILIQEVVLNGESLAAMKHKVFQRVKSIYSIDGTIQWIGWVDRWYALPGPI